jgi:hypothetical protein
MMAAILFLNTGFRVEALDHLTDTLSLPFAKLCEFFSDKFWTHAYEKYGTSARNTYLWTLYKLMKRDNTCVFNTFLWDFWPVNTHLYTATECVLYLLKVTVSHIRRSTEPRRQDNSFRLLGFFAQLSACTHSALITLVSTVDIFYGILSTL